MFTNLATLIGGFAHITYNTADVFGGFSLKRQVTVGLSCRGNTNKRSYFSEDGRTMIGDVPVKFIEPVNDPRGISTVVIGENGSVAPELFNAKAKASGAISRNAMLASAAWGSDFIGVDSQISLLVSMLSSYFVLAYKEAGSPLTLRDYEDGHLKMPLLDLISKSPTHTDMFTNEFISHQRWDQTEIGSEPSGPVLHTRGMSQQDVMIIVAHLSGRHKTTRLAFDLEVPALTSRVLMTGLVSTYELGDMAPLTSRDVRMALDKYVILSRLQSTFEAALAIYHQIAFTPLPDTAEGFAWLVRPRVVALPKFDAYRGAYSFLLEGLPFGFTTSTTESWKWWQEAGLGTAIPASCLTAFSLWGRYLAEAKFYHNDASIHELGDLQFGENPAAAYYCYAALITGKEIYCPLPRNVGLQYEPWLASTEFKIAVTVLDSELEGYGITRLDDGSAFLTVDRIPQPCSMINVLGRMPRDSAFSALSDRYQVHAQRLRTGWAIPNVNEAWGLGMAARWCGFDVEMEYRGVTRRGNWAPNRSSISTRPFTVDGPDILPVVLTGIGARTHQFMPLPPLDAEVNVWDVEVAVSDSISVTRHNGRPLLSRGTFVKVFNRKDGITLPPVESLAYMPVVTMATRRLDVHQAGFQVVSAITSHEPPGAVIPSQPAGQPPDTGAEQLDPAPSDTSGGAI